MTERLEPVEHDPDELAETDATESDSIVRDAAGTRQTLPTIPIGQPEADTLEQLAEVPDDEDDRR